MKNQIFFVILGIALTKWCAAQGITILPPPDGIREVVNYTVEETVFHRVPQSTPLSTLSPLDKQKTRKFKEIKQVEITIALNGDYSRTVNVLNPEEAYEEWPKSIEQIVVDQYGTRSYAPGGKLLNETPADSAYIARYQAAKSVYALGTSSYSADFPMPSPDMIDQLTDAGWIVTNEANNALSVEKGGVKTHYDPQTLTVTKTVMQGELLKSRLTTRYEITEQGILVPSLETKVDPIVRPSGACMELVRIKHYTHYSVAAIPAQPRESHIAASNQQLAVWPNPAQDNILVTLDQSVVNGGQLRVMDIAGNIYFTQTINGLGTGIKIPIATQPDGIYFVQITTTDGLKTLKFVKKSD